MTPWTERSGKFSPLKAAVFAGTLVPMLFLLYWAARGTLGPRALTEAIHQTGDWAIRFLMISLAVTPLRRILQLPRLILVRRMLGLAALAYALVHLVLYAADQGWNLWRVSSEIVLRYYLTIGFVALLGLVALGATSFDWAIRRLGGARWNRLHSIVYGIGVLAALHYFMQSKADVSQANLIAGFFLLLMFYRIAHARGLSLASPLVLAGTAIVAGIAAAAVEIAWYGAATGVPASRVFWAHFQFGFAIQPAWWVLATGLGVAAVTAIRNATARPENARRGRRAAAAA